MSEIRIGPAIEHEVRERVLHIDGDNVYVLRRMADLLRMGCTYTHVAVHLLTYEDVEIEHMTRAEWDALCTRTRLLESRKGS